MTPFGAVVRGAIAGAVGTLAMDLVWYQRYKSGGGEDSFQDWEFSSGTDSYESAAAPAQVGKRVVEGVLQKELKPETAGFMNNVVHWLTGVGWGVLYGITAGSFRKPNPVLGAPLGTGAWAASYAALAPMGLYRPMWEYDAKTLGKDLSAHVVFGLGTSTAFRLLARQRE